MTGFKYIQLHIGDFIGGVLHMDATEVGAYTMLLVAHYQAGEEGLPDDDRKLARIAKVSLKQWGRVKDTVMAKFELKDSFWRHSRVVDELREGKSKSADAKAKALKRWAGDDAAASAQHSHGNANQITSNQITNNQKIEREERTDDAPPAGVAAPSRTVEAKGQGREAPDATAAPDPAKPKAERGVRLKAFLDRQGEDEAGQEWGRWALTQGLNVAEINTELQKFCDYWNAQPGQKGVKLDWPATWRNWVRRVAENKQREEERRAIYRK